MRRYEIKKYTDGWKVVGVVSAESRAEAFRKALRAESEYSAKPGAIRVDPMQPTIEASDKAKAMIGGMDDKTK